jgi:hypothetical protein
VELGRRAQALAFWRRRLKGFRGIAAPRNSEARGMVARWQRVCFGRELERWRLRALAPARRDDRLVGPGRGDAPRRQEACCTPRRWRGCSPSPPRR